MSGARLVRSFTAAIPDIDFAAYGRSGAIVLFGLILFAGWGTVYLLNPDVYLRAMRVWVPEALPVPFADAIYVSSQLDCWRQGLDIFHGNVCDFLGRAMAYPPLWLRLWFLPADRMGGTYFGAVLAIAFILSLAFLPLTARKADMALGLAAVASSAVAYAVERGNVDLLIFVLAVGAVLSLERGLVWRTAGYTAIVLAALLKIYPIVLLVLIARERPGVAVAIALAAMGAIAASGLFWADQWVAMSPNIPLAFFASDGPGARKLPEGLYVLTCQLAEWLGLIRAFPSNDVVPRRLASAALFAVIVPGALAIVLRLARDPAFTVALRGAGMRERGCLAAGALLFCGCFVMGTSIAYREIVVLLALPALLRFRGEPGLWPAVTWIAWMTVPLMWVSFPALVLDMTFGALEEAGGPMPTFAFWLVRECLWWWLFIVLAAALLCLAGLSGRLNIQRDGRGNSPLPRRAAV